jgi:hypothetical protein
MSLNVPSLVINNDEEVTYTRDVRVTISITNVSDIIGYCIGEDTNPPDINSKKWFYTGIKNKIEISYRLSDGYGEKTVKIWVVDKAGNISLATYDTIIYEKERPDLKENTFITYPNPINLNEGTGMIIEYNAREGSEVEFEIYTITGSFVRKLKGNMYKAKWDGKNEKGDKVASGIYFVIMRVDNEIVSEKPEKIGVIK